MTFLSTNRVYSVEKAREKLGYEPIVGIEEGMRRTVEWLKEVDVKEALSK
jgi:sterol-4alpha-carboxylate 3-dehydrogenase (decarboxylating)